MESQPRLPALHRFTSPRRRRLPTIPAHALLPGLWLAAIYLGLLLLAIKACWS